MILHTCAYLFSVICNTEFDSRHEYGFYRKMRPQTKCTLERFFETFECPDDFCVNPIAAVLNKWNEFRLFFRFDFSTLMFCSCRMDFAARIWFM